MDVESDFIALDIETTWLDVEREYIKYLLKETCGNVSLACKYSGYSRSRLYKLIGVHGLHEFMRVCRLRKPLAAIQPKKAGEVGHE
jgi:DNA-binding NtrC family response regulator